MLSGYQLVTVAYHGEDGEIFCEECYASPPGNVSLDANEADDYEQSKAISQYEANELARDDGLYCDDCGVAIIEPYDGPIDDEDNLGGSD
jgi:hypothetical protein